MGGPRARSEAGVEVCGRDGSYASGRRVEPDGMIVPGVEPRAATTASASHLSAEREWSSGEALGSRANCVDVTTTSMTDAVRDVARAAPPNEKTAANSSTSRSASAKRLWSVADGRVTMMMMPSMDRTSRSTHLARAKLDRSRRPYAGAARVRDLDSPSAISPTTRHASATLNTGQCETWMKSTT